MLPEIWKMSGKYLKVRYHVMLYELEECESHALVGINTPHSLG